MKKILLLAFVEENGALGKPALEALSGACELAQAFGAALNVGLIGEFAQKAADSIASCGANQILAVQGPEFASARCATDSAAAVALIRAAEADFVLAPQTTRSARCMPGAAFRAKGRIDTRITGLRVDEGTLLIQRWYYRQRMVAELTRSQRPWVVLLEAGVFNPWSEGSGHAAVSIVPVEPVETRTRIAGIEPASAGTQTIRPDADLLFVAGAGWTKKQTDGEVHVEEAENLIRSFLDLTHASLGSSKSLVDQSGEGQKVISLLTHMHQVGQTGSTPRHPKGLATCCHGEEPHVVGWRFINERRAVNLDPNCGWARGKADVLYVADAFAVMGKVIELLGKDTGQAAV
ncbi:MAG TPA: electron transfer flavoprotein subunit alpha [Candidatus Latescibacteria bacterium]|nr:electron transfer flavoprotein subunit alpha [Candidatus Latescibacterota bacterium]